jgi:Protein of unknown function (DUF3795)
MRMEPILSLCGYRCDLCLAYKPNVEAHPENQHKLSDGWFKYFGFRIPAEQILCDGCLAENPRLIDKSCPVRPCVTTKQLENCSGCSEYGCDKLRERFVVFEDVARRLGRDVPEEDRLSFIHPYENRSRLEQIRAGRKD